ncbi:MAG: hypothetical protein RLZZ387_5173 [Chloroflexota bacterium]
MSNDGMPSFTVSGSSQPVPLRSPRVFWQYAATQWRRIFGLNISRIDDLLFVGGQFHAAQWPQLRALGVRAVLSLQQEHADEFHGEPPDQALRLLVPDFHPPEVEQLREACAFIREAHAAGLPVMVHCHAGVGRAPLTAAAHLIQQGATTEQALHRIRLARPIIALNAIQLARLLEWERLARAGDV